MKNRLFKYIARGWLILFYLIFLSNKGTSQTLVWQDEFNGTTLNTNFWTYDFGDGCQRSLCGWGNSELENYTTRPDNVRIENGNLIIEAKSETYGNSSFTSGRIKTEGRVHFKYGTVEARIKIPNLANGLWPAFWTLGTVGGTWPNIGEIDIMEMGNQSARLANLINKQVTCANHWSNNGAYTNSGSSINNSTDLNNDYHIYKMVWNSQTITMYLDGVSFYTFDISNPSTTSREEFHNPHFLLLNMAIGGAYTGLLSSSSITATMPAQMLVDYVRVYQNPGDQLVLGTQNLTSGNYGVFTETATVTDSLIIGTNTTLNYWNNLAAISGAQPFEGNKLWAIKANAGNWFGMGIDNKYMNLSGHTAGSLKFHFKTSYNGQFKFGIKSGDGESWVNFPAGSTSYGLIRDGSWHEISIPLADFNVPTTNNYIDYTSVKSAFMFAGDAPSVNAEFFIDNIYITKNTIAPTLGQFSVPAKNLGEPAFAITPPLSNSPGSFYYSSSNTAVATISGNMITIIGVGTSVITAVQSASGNYGSATTSSNFMVSISSPSIPANTPPLRNSNDFLSLFSNAYTNINGVDWNPNWSQSTIVSEVNISSNATKKYESFNYQGVQLSGSINVSGMTYMHIDVWTPNCNTFDVYLINTSPSLVEQKVSLTPTFLGWNSFDILLSQYNTIALNNINQLKFVGNPFGSSVIYFDNVYFWRNSNSPALSNFNIPQKTIGDSSFIITPPTSNSSGVFSYSSSNTAIATINGNRLNIIGVGTAVITAFQAAAGSFSSGTISTNFIVNYPAPSSAAPTPPVRVAGDFISIYSDSYANVTGTDFNPYWSQSTLVTDFSIAGNNNKKYDQFNYQGIQLASIVNATGMQYVHIDIWTPNISGFDLYLINTTPVLVEQKVTVTPVLNNWNSFDIPLSAFNNVALNNLTQFKLEARPFGTSVLFWDNLYFWKSASLNPPSVTTTQPSCTNATGTITISTIPGLNYSIDGVNYNNSNGVFSGLNPGTYNVTSRNSIGNTSAPTVVVINYSPTVPNAPAIIYGVRNINQCDTLQTYYVTNNSDLNYIWTVSGTGNSIKMGQGTSRVVLNMKVAGTITVKVSNICGTSGSTTLAVIKSIPTAPSTVTNTNTNVCLFTNSAFLTNGIKDTFRVKSVANATGYIWELPGGSTYQQLTDTSIAVIFSDTITLSTTSPRYVKVYSLSACDTSLAKSITLTKVIPSTPANILKEDGVSTATSNVCSSVGSSLIYKIRKVANATAYSWQMKFGANVSITHLNPLGVNDTAISVNYLNGFSKDSLLVTANNCASSAQKKLMVSAILTPPTPTSITSSTASYNGCIGNSITYTVVVGLPSATQNVASVYRWTKPNNTAIINSNADSSIITIQFNQGYTGGSLTAKGQTLCGIQGSAKSQALTHTACPSGTKLIDVSTYLESEQGQSNSIIFPNPNKGIFSLIINSNSKYNSSQSKIIITDIYGRVVEEENIPPINGGINKKINLPNLTNGLYFLIYKESKNYKKILFEIRK